MVRPLVEDKVDRLEVYVPRGIQLTSTNRSRAYPKFLAHKFASSFQGTHPELHTSSDDGEKVTPVPIPNTEVKLLSADGTWTAGSWESRTLPGWNHCFHSLIAQLVEHSTVNRVVTGSSPVRGAICSHSSVGRVHPW